MSCSIVISSILIFFSALVRGQSASQEYFRYETTEKVIRCMNVKKGCSACEDGSLRGFNGREDNRVDANYRCLYKHITDNPYPKLKLGDRAMIKDAQGRRSRISPAQRKYYSENCYLFTEQCAVCPDGKVISPKDASPTGKSLYTCATSGESKKKGLIARFISGFFSGRNEEEHLGESFEQACFQEIRAPNYSLELDPERTYQIAPKILGLNELKRTSIVPMPNGNLLLRTRGNKHAGATIYIFGQGGEIVGQHVLTERGRGNISIKPRFTDNGHTLLQKTERGGKRTFHLLQPDGSLGGSYTSKEKVYAADITPEGGAVVIEGNSRATRSLVFVKPDGKVSKKIRVTGLDPYSNVSVNPEGTVYITTREENNVAMRVFLDSNGAIIKKEKGSLRNSGYSNGRDPLNVHRLIARSRQVGYTDGRIRVEKDEKSGEIILSDYEVGPKLVVAQIPASGKRNEIFFPPKMLPSGDVVIGIDGKIRLYKRKPKEKPYRVSSTSNIECPPSSENSSQNNSFSRDTLPTESPGEHNGKSGEVLK